MNPSTHPSNPIVEALRLTQEAIRQNMLLTWRACGTRRLMLPMTILLQGDTLTVVGIELAIHPHFGGFLPEPPSLTIVRLQELTAAEPAIWAAHTPPLDAVTRYSRQIHGLLSTMLRSVSTHVNEVTNIFNNLGGLHQQACYHIVLHEDVVDEPSEDTTGERLLAQPPIKDEPKHATDAA